MIETERLVLHPLPRALVAGDAAPESPFDIDDDTFTADERALLRRYARR